MSFAPPRRPSPPAQRRLSPLAITVIVLAVVVVAVLLLAQFWTEVMWFQALDFGRVIWTQWIARGILFAAAFLLMSGALYWSFSAAYRSRPVYAPSTPEQATLDQYREAVEPLRRVVMIAAPLVIGFFAGVAAAAQWRTVILALNAVPFGAVDPEFEIDQSFYIFQLPALRFVLSLLIAVVIVSGIAALITHYLYGGLRVGPVPEGTPRTTTAARVQLAVTGAVLMLLLAVNYWLDRYSLLTSSGDKFDGASYSDVHAVIPSKAILAGVAVLVAIAFIVAAVRGNWRIPAIGVGLMVVSAIAIGGIFPWAMQRFQVQPNAQELETPYIQRNIDATLSAFGLDELDTQQYPATTTAEAGALREDAETTASIRLLDPLIVSPSFRQLQQNKQYYDFQDQLSVDRYTIGGQSRDTVIAVRELNLEGLGATQRNWVNDHTVFTHGYGVVAAFGNQTGTDGRPAFFEGGIPTAGELTDAQDYEPRIYFSPKTTAFSIVGAPEGTPSWELDYQADDDQGGGQVNTTFPTQEIDAGPPIGTFGNKLLYAIKFGSQEILFSDRVTSESQILYDRDPQERVAKVAPWLTLDHRVYPAVVDGRVKWIVDGYTTSDAFPYSTAAPMSESITDSITLAQAQAQGTMPALPQSVNYIRNSVKATVDAFTGEVTLYAWEPDDPILQAWQNVFPGSVEPMSEISGDLMGHLRYPEDLFKVQRALLQRYHVTDPAQFFTSQDLWQTPLDPVDTGSVTGVRALQPPYYLTLQMPDQDSPAFSLTTLYIPGGNSDREILTGFLAVDAEAGSDDGVRAESYGKLRMLAMPRDNTVPGPGQVQNNFNSNTEFATQLNVLQLGDSIVLRGNQLTLPVGGGLLYVQPVYVQSRTGTQFPLLRKVLVSFGDSIGFADTLDAALDQVFGGDSGLEPGDVDLPEIPVLPETPTLPEEPTDPTEPTEPTEPTAPPTGSGDARADLNAALQDANEALQEGQAALQDGDFAGYGAAQERLREALERALAADEALGN
ncbi:protein of unknown function UPF0182 [Xylanimonas cellulosilytica DSM 15894]|uniref:UPF0182 protein Xcel_0793 n=1 Tax=Xylanimonas cellulosilytica (strain DSM 15894 / JCM 12276 / CECT 5975 / KCTC 9989 / LMG 20990 / NBRC 107835 / XIL07) TaxID=446471 RepID=D1BXM1_XYLCX|nr:UPF0182 family protein [Xylanimonas cellulosilytica]ACZ29831.1 protein of unknown function UPF0182 [Xylanimonas cellulosilytica DSM 15894]